MCEFDKEIHYATEVYGLPCPLKSSGIPAHNIKRSIQRSLGYSSSNEELQDSINGETDGFGDELTYYLKEILAMGTDSDSDGSGIKNLYPAIVECFVVIFIGYLTGKFGILTQSESRGINKFIGTFSLPALIFSSLAHLDLSSVNWWFLLAIAISKSIVFFTVMVISILVSNPTKLDKAAIYAIFCTQSNDFALGYPIVKALFDETHPEYAGYLYLVAPVSLIFLNPIGFVLMEISKQKKLEAADDGDKAILPLNKPSYYNCGLIFRKVVKGVMLNPIIIMTAMGILGNIVFRNCVPVMLDGILKMLGAAFSACALFSLGLTMVGSAASLKGSGFILPAILIIIKLLVLPVVTREVVSLLQAGADINETISLSNYGFLYGTFPTAPGVFVYANQYEIAIQMIAGAMVACTFFSAPLMFISAKMITLTAVTPSTYLSELDSFLFKLSIVGLVAALWVIGVFLLSKKWRKVPHCFTLCLVVSQAIACTGAILWSYLGVQNSQGIKLYLQFCVFSFGVLSCRIWTAILAASIVFLRCRSLCFMLKIRPYLAVIGWGVPGSLVLLLMLVVGRETLLEKRDPNFQYGQTQALVAMIVLVVSLIVTVGCLVMQKRYERKYQQYNPVPRTQHVSDEESGDDTDQRETNPTLKQNHSCTTLSSIATASTSVSCFNTPVLQHRGRGPTGSGAPGSHFNESPSSEFPVTGQSSRNNPTKIVRKGGQSIIKINDIEDLPSSNQHDSDEDSLFNYEGKLCLPNKNCTANQRKRCSNLLDQYRSVNYLTEPEEIGIVRDRDDEYQVSRHLILLLALCASMFVGTALCMWTLIMENVSGIYVELVFLDAALNFGQSFFTFMLFGLDTKMIVMPLIKWWRIAVYGEKQVRLPKFEELSNETKHTCEQFVTYHLEKCVNDIVRDRSWRMEHFKDVFFGNEFVDWLLLVGLAEDRNEGATYGRHLLDGRVIRHANNIHHFYDQPFFYTFNQERSNT